MGVLFARLSEYILRNSSADVLLVDSWAPESEQPEHYIATGDAHSRHSRRRALKNKAEAVQRILPFGGRAAVMHATSADAASCVPDASLDMVFLDADHSYEGVRDDLAAWVAKIKPGGWIGGHDYGNREPAYDFSGVKRAVDEWAISASVAVETDLNFTWFARMGAAV